MGRAIVSLTIILGAQIEGVPPGDPPPNFVLLTPELRAGFQLRLNSPRINV